MPRIRYLKPEFFFDDDLAELNFECRLFFQGLWCYADKAGRLEDKPKVLKAQIMPYDNVNADRILNKLGEKFISRYEIEGRKYIQINNFLKHQSPHHTEKNSIIPSFNGVKTVNVPSRDRIKEKEKEKEKGKRKVDEFILAFESRWKKYPNKDSHKDSLKYWTASVKTKQDLKDFDTALSNYLELLRANTWRKPKSGKTFFHNWRDFLNYKEEKIKPKWLEELA